jgi:hypothetical protein
VRRRLCPRRRGQIRKRRRPHRSPTRSAERRRGSHPHPRKGHGGRRYWVRRRRRRRSKVGTRRSSSRGRWHHHHHWRRGTGERLLGGRKGWRRSPRGMRGRHGAPVASGRRQGRPWRGRDEARPNPRPVSGGGVNVEGNARYVVGTFRPSVREGRDEGVVLAPGPDECLLGAGQPHRSTPPVGQVPLVVDPKVLPELPSPPLLLPSRGAVVRQVRVGVIVEEAGHWMKRFSLGLSDCRAHQDPGDGERGCVCERFP